MNREIIDINDYTILLEEASTDNNLIDSCFFDEPVIAIAFYGAGDVSLNVKFDGKAKEFHRKEAMRPRNTVICVGVPRNATTIQEKIQ